MDHPTAQHQELIETDQNMMVVCPNNSKADQRKARPQPEHALKCPRCDSTNTKFCYYNNYSLSQPRYFCKSCRRYWTQGGTLRNVPVGGGCRKNKRSSSSSSSSCRKSQDHHSFPGGPLSTTYDHDLSLAFARLHKNTSSCGPAAAAFNDFDFSILGMPNADVINGGGFGYNNNNSSQTAAVYYANDDNNNNVGGIEQSSLMTPYEYQYSNNSSSNNNSNATTTAVTVTTMKQELFGCGGDRESNESSSRILWGYPNWQMNNNINNNAVLDSSNMGDLDFDSAAARQSWNSFNASSSWHGLLNSPLM